MDFLRLAIPPGELVLRSAVIYVALLTGLRLFGKREVGQFTLFDLVLVLLVANAVQPAMTGPDASVTGGVLIIATLLLLNWAVGWLRARSARFARLVSARAVALARAGAWNQAELRRQGISDEEAMEALREHGLERIEETRLVMLEPDGSLSVVPKDELPRRHRRRHVRFIKHP
jgi:uncharacterized membrane protein YcaP (DUF421 family)